MNLMSARRFFKFFLIGCLVVVLNVFSASVFAATYAQPKNAVDNQWRFYIAPYFWGPWMSGQQYLKGDYVNINVSPGDLLEVLDFVLQVHMEAAKGNWSFMVDPTYIKLTDSVTVNEILGGKWTLKMSLIDFGIYYRFMNTVLNSRTNSSVSLEALLGGRYVGVDVKLNPNQLPNVKGDKDWLDPVIGYRFIYNINPKWIVTFKQDAGGFGVGSHFSSETALFAHYKFCRYASVALGLRVLGYNYSTGHGANKFKLDLIQYGPVIGLGFYF